MKLTEIDIVVNNQYYLYIPADGIDLVLLRNDFNLLTNDIASMRPMYVTQQFELPYDRNVEIFKKLKNKEKTFQLLYNRTTILIGSIVDFSVDEQRRVMLVSISSRFKDVIDYLGNNVLYLDNVDLSYFDMIIPAAWTTANNNDIVKWAYYNPMNTETGQLAKTDDNIRQYCKPSFHILTYLKEAFGQIGWTLNEAKLPASWQNLVIAPSTKYQVTSFRLRYSNTKPFTIKAQSNYVLKPSRGGMTNISIDGVKSVSVSGVTGLITLMAPNRLQHFKINGKLKSTDSFYLNLREENIETPLIQWQYIGGGEEGSVTQISDSVNTKEGLNNIYLEIYNPNIDDINVEVTQLFLYNLIPIYETNQDELISPAGYYFSVADNIPQITGLTLYRELLVLFQIAQSADDITKNVDYYYINEIFKKTNKVDTNKFVFWDGYESLGDSIEGLARNNTIRYKSDTKRQKAFNVNLPQLPSNNVYYESIFAHGEMNNAWGALTIPALNYKVKLVDNVSIEYLEWKDITPLLANYVEDESSIGAHLSFNGLSINELTAAYWDNIIKFMSTTLLQTPSVFKLKLRVNYFDYIRKFSQNNLFLYKENSIMVKGQYNVLNHELEGTFVSLQ